MIKKMTITVAPTPLRFILPCKTPHPLIERPTLVIYALIAISTAVIAIAVAATPFTYDGARLNAPLAWLVVLGTCGLALRRLGYPNIGGFLEATVMLTALSCAAAWGSALLAATAWPLTDALLMRVDAALLFGLSWRQLIPFVAEHSRLMIFLSHIYATLNWQPTTLLLLLFVGGRSQRCWIFVLAWGLTLAACVLVFPFFPAVGAYLHLGVSSADVPGVRVAAAWRHVELLLPVRDGSMRTISPNSLYGIITFPSFHAAAAVLLGWGGWSIRLLRWPCALLNTGMFCSALFIGAHYFVDLIAGGMIAAAAISVSVHLIDRPASNATTSVEASLRG